MSVSFVLVSNCLSHTYGFSGLVVEDAPSGIRAGKAAGAKVLGLLTSHPLDQVMKEEPDWIVEDLSK